VVDPEMATLVVVGWLRSLGEVARPDAAASP